MNKIVLAIDIGSSSIRCSAYTLTVSIQQNEQQNELQKEEQNHKHASAVLTLLPKHSSSHKMQCVSPSTSKIPAKKILDQVDCCIDTTLSSLRNQKDLSPFQIISVGISSFVMNLLAINVQTGEIVESFSYACKDPKVIEIVKDLEYQLGEQQSLQMFQTTGAPLHSAYALPQLYHYYSNDYPNNNDDTKSKNIYFQTLSSMCIARWQNRTHLNQISFSEASWTGLFDFTKCTWDSTALSLLPDNIHLHLPTPVDPAQYPMSISSISNNPNFSKYVEKWPELYEGHTVFYLGEGDGACANIGSKCTSTNRVAITIGTSAAVRVCISYSISNLHSKTSKDVATTVDKINISKGLFCYRVNSNKVLIGGALTDGGSVVEWIRNLLQLHTLSQSNKKDTENSVIDFDTCLQQVQKEMSTCPTSNTSPEPNITVIPFLSGERSTGFRANATGCIFGVTRQTTPAMLLRACLEGVVLRLYAIVTLLLPLLKSFPSNYTSNDINASLFNTQSNNCECISGKNMNNHNSTNVVIVASGTALERNMTWRQMIADCTGYDVILDKEGRTESTSRGIARIVAINYLRDPRWMEKQNYDKIIVEESLFVEDHVQPRTSSVQFIEYRKSYWEKSLKKQEAFIQAVSSLWE